MALGLDAAEVVWLEMPPLGDESLAVCLGPCCCPVKYAPPLASGTWEGATLYIERGGEYVELEKYGRTPRTASE